MKIIMIIVCFFGFFIPISAIGQSTENLSIPAIAFHGERVIYNNSGTAAFFRTKAFAPVFLPDGARAFSFTCGARTVFGKGITIKLRRNHPQQANVDMGVAEIPKGGDGNFKFVTVNRLTDGVIDNSRFNYYLIAETIPKSATTGVVCNPAAGGTECLVAACRIGFFPP